MSALVAESTQPNAVIVALPGGAVTSGYFDAPDQPRLSLLRTGAALGFTVIALDRQAPCRGSLASEATGAAGGARAAAHRVGTERPLPGRWCQQRRTVVPRPRIRGP